MDMIDLVNEHSFATAMSQAIRRHLTTIADPMIAAGLDLAATRLELTANVIDVKIGDLEANKVAGGD